MNAIEEIQAKRGEDARFWKNNPDLLKFISEHIYPDKAHFIYELLQNAEDTGATKVSFDLRKDKLFFEHNGRPFNIDDIVAITHFSKSLKEKDKIGRFGIGFKAVYNYTNTPHIWSSTYSFKIKDYCLPYEIKQDESLGNITRFMFPFDKTDKKKVDIYQEIIDGLNDIYRTTLLFLGNIKSIVCMHNEKEAMSITRAERSLNHVAIEQKKSGKSIGSSHYLLFKKAIENFENRHVALAYELELPRLNATDSNKANDKFKIKGAAPGKVAIYLPAQKETSNLKFHLHAPFVPVGGRSEIKDCEENQALIQQLAALSAESLPVIKENGMLDRDFLEVLPNKSDDLPDKYDCIRVAIVNAMQRHPLTPTHSGAHLPANKLWRGSMNVRRLLSSEDIKFWYQNGPNKKIDWAVGVMQGSRAANFLNDLDMEWWKGEVFTQILIDKIGGSKSERKKIHDWLDKKPNKWLQYLYALLDEEVDDVSVWQKLKGLKIVKVANGGYKKGEECFFSNLDEQEDDQYPRVVIETYRTSKAGNEEDTERKSRMFLEQIGVRELGALEQVEALLNRKYSSEKEFDASWKDYLTDVAEFVKASNDDSASIELMKNYNIFLSSKNILTKPENIYIDAPFLNTGLKAYYDLINPGSGKNYRLPLSKQYMKLSKENKAKFIELATSCGIAINLEPRKTSCNNNPVSSQLYSARGVRRSNCIDEDFVVDQLDVLLEKPTEALSRLIWSNLEYWHNKYFEAKYQPNNSSDPSYAPSQLLHLLISSDWVPQIAKKSVRFVCPAEAKQKQLPKDFSFPRHAPWLEKIRFGQGSVENEEMRDFAKQVGCSSVKEVQEGIRISRLLQKIRPDIFKQLNELDNSQLPEQKSKNPDRRKKQVRQGAKSAPKREVTSKEVNVSNVDTVKKDLTHPYLQDMYTSDESMICQVCRHELPFKLPDGKYYFEMVELFSGFERVHRENYIALCPNHAAMYKHANNSKDEMLKIFNDLAPEEQILDLTLAGEPMKLYFATDHINDLKEVIDVENND